MRFWDLECGGWDICVIGVFLVYLVLYCFGEVMILICVVGELIEGCCCWG